MNTIMRVSKVNNASLLAVLARKCKITYEDLKKEYCSPTPLDVLSGRNLMFDDSDLKVLESESYNTDLIDTSGGAPLIYIVWMNVE